MFSEECDLPGLQIGVDPRSAASFFFATSPSRTTAISSRVISTKERLLQLLSTLSQQRGFYLPSCSSGRTTSNFSVHINSDWCDLFKLWRKSLTQCISFSFDMGGLCDGCPDVAVRWNLFLCLIRFVLSSRPNFSPTFQTRRLWEKACLVLVGDPPKPSVTNFPDDRASFWSLFLRSWCQRGDVRVATADGFWRKGK